MIYVNIIGIAVLSVFTLFILTKKNKGLGDYLLVLIIFLFSGVLASGILLESEVSVVNYVLFLFFNSFIFPSLIIYGLVLIDSNHQFKLRWLWTASYAILFMSFICFDTLYTSKYTTEEQINALVKTPSIVYNILYKGQYLFVIATLLWFINRLNKYQRNLKNFFSSIDSIHLNWFKNFTIIYLLVNIVSLILFIILDLNMVSDIFIPLLIEHVILVISLFYLCFYGIRQYSLAYFKSLLNSITNKSVSGKYSTSSLSTKEMNALFEKIEVLFRDENIFLESDLKIESIAERLAVGNHKVSQTINTIAKQSFYDYVNTFRVDYLKILLENEEHRKFTILALGIESGFNSKSSLNRIFKQHTGISPKSYQLSKVS